MSSRKDHQSVVINAWGCAKAYTELEEQVERFSRDKFLSICGLSARTLQKLTNSETTEPKTLSFLTIKKYVIGIHRMRSLPPPTNEDIEAFIETRRETIASRLSQQRDRYLSGMAFSFQKVFDALHGKKPLAGVSRVTTDAEDLTAAANCFLLGIHDLMNPKIRKVERGDAIAWALQYERHSLESFKKLLAGIVNYNPDSIWMYRDPVDPCRDLLTSSIPLTSEGYAGYCKGEFDIAELVQDSTRSSSYTLILEQSCGHLRYPLGQRDQAVRRLMCMGWLQLGLLSGRLIDDRENEHAVRLVSYNSSWYVKTALSSLGFEEFNYKSIAKTLGFPLTQLVVSAEQAGKDKTHLRNYQLLLHCQSFARLQKSQLPN